MRKSLILIQMKHPVCNLTIQGIQPIYLNVQHRQAMNCADVHWLMNGPFIKCGNMFWYTSPINSENQHVYSASMPLLKNVSLIKNRGKIQSRKFKDPTSPLITRTINITTMCFARAQKSNRRNPRFPVWQMKFNLPILENILFVLLRIACHNLFGLYMCFFIITKTCGTFYAI